MILILKFSLKIKYTPPHSGGNQIARAKGEKGEGGVQNFKGSASRGRFIPFKMDYWFLPTHIMGIYMDHFSIFKIYHHFIINIDLCQYNL